MKKIFITLLVMGVTLSLYGHGMCAQQSKLNTNPKSLIIYYSLSGNTKTVVHILQELVNSESMEIKTVRPYPDDFHAVVEQAREERRAHFLPPIQPLDRNLQEYDVIYLGFPIWGNTIPQPMATFLSQNNLAGKTIIPFCTHDGYGVGRSFQVIGEYCPDARVLDGFDMLGANARNARTLLIQWLDELGINSGAATSAADSNATEQLTITIGKRKLAGVLASDVTAEAFKKLLPVTIAMVQYGGREYYGPLDARIDTQAKGRLRFDDGDITYCPWNNTIAIFYSQTSRPNLTMHVIPIGKVTSDLSIFDTLDPHVDMTFSLER